MNPIPRLIPILIALALLAPHPRLVGETLPVLTTLHAFTETGKDGASPFAGLLRGSDGNFYGTTQNGGTSLDGTVFKMTPAGAVTTLHSFTGKGSDGTNPVCSLIEGTDGNFYGTTTVGGTGGNGTIFKITRAGVFTTLFSFAEDAKQGAFPEAGVIQGTDGNFYGTTGDGGASFDGTVFKMTPAGVLTVLHSFSGTSTDGAGPLAALVQGRDGNFYGTNTFGGAGDEGTIFKISAAGVTTTLHSFKGGGTDGSDSRDALIQGTDGNFYGTTSLGGSSNAGTVFKMTPAGGITILHHFTSANGVDGERPYAPLLEASDGNFYGTTFEGGSGDEGTIFRLTPAGAFTTLHAFSARDDSSSNSDGAVAAGALVEGGDGSLYGTCAAGGSRSVGTVYKLAFPPVITSPATAMATLGKAFSYQIAATNNPTSFGVLGLPPGLKANAGTGLISGTPTATGTRKLTLKATNSIGTGEAFLTLTIYAAAPPVITSANAANATKGKAFSFQIKATNGPTSFGAVGLPAGLKVDSKTGLISGLPTVSGAKVLMLKAANAYGNDEQTFTLTILGPPAITSAKTAGATVGKVFSYQITATNHPVSYGVVGLPAGLKVDGKTGYVSGSPMAAGTRSLMLKATNAAGTGQETLALTINAK